MSREVWVYSEHRDGILHEVSLEILTKGREIADKIKGSLSAVLMGDDLDAVAEVLIDYGADRVHLIEHSDLPPYPGHKTVEILCELVKEYNPEVFLFGATSIGGELAPKIACRLRTGLSAHCIDLDFNENGHLQQVVPAFGGGVLATIVCPDRKPQMATIKPGVMKVGKKESRNGEVLKREICSKNESEIKILETIREVPMEMPLEKAEIVVAGGWGVGDKEHWQKLEELAALLQGGVGATRPAVDEGWAKEFQMIGQSGKTVRPKLYIGFGISGVMHHMVGIQDSGFVIAVNNGANADIFKMCDFGVVGDLKKVLPHLINEIKKV